MEVEEEKARRVLGNVLTLERPPENLSLGSNRKVFRRMEGGEG